ncbi:MAG: universal stress protein [Paracoccus sp. (in: a-proteobacteria)]
MFKTILLPIDIQHPASWSQALPVARQLLEADGELHILGIVHDVGNAWVASYLPRGYEQRALEEMKSELNAFVARELPDGRNVITHVGHGHVAETIIDMAQKARADLIVMAARSPDELRTFRIASQADRVVRHSPVSVMILR